MHEKTVLIRGAGEKATAVACGLHCVGFTMIVMTDLPLPRSERRGVCFSEAIVDRRKEIEGVVAERSEASMGCIFRAWAERKIPVIVDPEAGVSRRLRPDVLIDGVMAKQNRGTGIDDAPLVIALGPGFTAGKDCHLVVETNPASSYLGSVVWTGRAEENTQVPTMVLGLSGERIIRSPAEGRLVSLKGIGAQVKKDETIGYVNETAIKAPISGCIWGLMRDGLRLKKGQKIGDMDPRGEPERCFQITPESRTIAQGVLLGIYSYERQLRSHSRGSFAKERGDGPERKP